jgi:hypothetical protein
VRRYFLFYTPGKGENMAESEGVAEKWFVGNVALADGTRFYAYNSTTDSPEVVTASIQAEYDAADPILELAEQTARELGTSASRLLEMATLKAKRNEQVLGNE